jgi:hypothetical protein
LRRRSRLTWPMGLGMGRLVRWWPRGRAVALVGSYELLWRLPRFSGVI